MAPQCSIEESTRSLLPASRMAQCRAWLQSGLALHASRVCARSRHYSGDGIILSSLQYLLSLLTEITVMNGSQY